MRDAIKTWIDGWMKEVEQRAAAYRANGVPADVAEETAVAEVRMEIRRSSPPPLLDEKK